MISSTRPRPVRSGSWVALLALLMCVAACGTQDAAEEWRRLPSPAAASMTAFCRAPDGALYASSSSALYKSEDGGRTWQGTALEGPVSGLHATPTGTILAGLYRTGLLRSVDGGATWTPVGFEHVVYIFSIVGTPDGRVYLAATFRQEDSPEDARAGVFVSDDDGISWQPTGLAEESAIGVFAPVPGLLFASTKGERPLYRSTDGGRTWSGEAMGLPDSIPVAAMVQSRGRLLAAVGDLQDAALTDGGGAFASDDDGLTWRRSDAGIGTTTRITGLALVDSTLFAVGGNYSAGGARGVFSSTDFGTTWQPAGLNSEMVRFIGVTADGRLLAGTEASTLHMSADLGRTWIATGKEIDDWSVYDIAANGNGLFVCTDSGIWRSSRPVRRWEPVLAGYGSITSLADGSLLACVDGDVLRAGEDGRDWRKLSELPGKMQFLEVSPGGQIVASAEEFGLFYSQDDGETWQPYELGEFAANYFRASLQAPDGSILAGSYRGTLRSTDGGRTWTNVDDGFMAWSFIAHDGILYAGGYASGVHVSEDRGATWSDRNTGLRAGNDYVTVTGLASLPDGSVVAATLGSGMFRLTAGESAWRPWQDGMGVDLVYGVRLTGDGSVYAATTRGLYVR